MSNRRERTFERRVRTPITNPDKDRTLAGKDRIRARKAARRLARRPFFKGHGVASSNAYNQRYDCPCGLSTIAPLDDAEFMTEVMEHEQEHAEERAQGPAETAAGVA